MPHVRQSKKREHLFKWTPEEKELDEILKKGNYTVYSKLNQVSRSGMKRAISFYVIIDNKPFNIDYAISKVLKYKRDKNYDGLVVHGCGMDMGFHVVNSLSTHLYAYRTPDGSYSHEGAYKLEQKWL